MKLILNEFGSALRKRGDCLAVHRKEGPPIEVPLEAVSDILIAGSGISLSADAVALACRAGIVISFLSTTGEPYAQAAPPFPGRDAALRLKQYDAVDKATGIRLAQRTLKVKLANQANLLKYFAKSRRHGEHELAEYLLAQAESIQRQGHAMAEEAAEPAALARAALMGHEGAAGQAYWRAIVRLVPPPLRFTRRVHQSPPDAFNMALNYGYGILRSRIWSATVLRGLDPAAGFLHAWQKNRDSLVLDLIEVFRQVAVDRPVVAAVLRQWEPREGEEPGRLDDASRKEVATLVLEQLESTLRCGRQEKTLLAWIDAEVEACARILQGEPAGPPPLAAW